MAWLFLIIAGILETTWVAVIRGSRGMDKDRPWLQRLVFLLAIIISTMSMTMMYWAMDRKISMGTSYAVWTGIGAIGTTVLGILIFSEPFQWSRIFFVLLIVTGMVGAYLTSPQKYVPATPPEHSQEG